jgi:uracil-DNA glycosylase
MTKHDTLSNLLTKVRACDICAEYLSLGPRPVVQISPTAKVLLIGQAPGTKVHETGIPFNDPSGDRLRSWLQMDRDTFYHSSKLNIMPMGFCYPGKKGGGDAPPRPECAPEWHDQLRKLMPNLKTTLLVGKYAMDYYLGDSSEKTLTATVEKWEAFTPEYLVFPHPSPRNIRWFKKNAWFEADVIPAYRKILGPLL